jgi:branched-subunit amino acid transport protein AzlD
VKAKIFRGPFFVNLFPALPWFLPPFVFDTLSTPSYIPSYINWMSSTIVIMSTAYTHQDLQSSTFEGFQPEAVKVPGLTKSSHEIERGWIF